MKRFLKSALRGLVLKVRTQLDWWDRELLRENMEQHDYNQDDLIYPWLNYKTETIVQRDKALVRPNYTWGVVQAVHLAKVLNLKRISVIEFGVAGGNGLLALERAAEIAEAMFEVTIDVYGFDSGRGLPKAQDYRDLPNFWKEASFPMEFDKLKARLRRAHLLLGLVSDTLDQFLRSRPAPVGFVSFDLDYYSSTKDALRLFEADQELLLPRVHCYFDDIMGFTYSEFTGERLAIREFNEAQVTRKIDKIHGLPYYLPAHYRHELWPEQMFLLHIFNHPQYTEYDQLHKESRSRNLELPGG
jgi:hypothetical protein